MRLLGKKLRAFVWIVFCARRKRGLWVIPGDDRVIVMDPRGFVVLKTF